MIKHHMSTKKNSNTKNILLYGFLGTVILGVFLIYRLTSPKPLTRDECYRLGSNERMQFCLIEIENREKTPASPPPLPSVTSAVSALGAEWIWEGQQPIIYVKTQNNSDKYIDTVRYQIKYFTDKKATCVSNNVADTQETNVVVEIAPTSIKRVGVPVETTLNQNGGLIFCVETLGAVQSN